MWIELDEYERLALLVGGPRKKLSKEVLNLLDQVYELLHIAIEPADLPRPEVVRELRRGRKWKKILTSEELTILSSLYGLRKEKKGMKKPLKELAKKLGMSESRVEYLFSRALKKLREYFKYEYEVQRQA